MKKQFIVKSMSKNLASYDCHRIIEAESYDGAWQKVVEGALFGDHLYDIKAECLSDGISCITIYEVAGSRNDHFPAWLKLHIEQEKARRASEERGEAQQEYERMREECRLLEAKFGFNRY